MGAPHDLATGVVLADRYRLDDVLGQGGMATVHRAHDLVLGRDVAVKLFPPVAEGADELQRHQAEMRVLARLNHPGLVTLHDAGRVPAGGPLRQTYLVMELVTGRTLADRLLAGPLPPVDVSHLGRQVAEALVVVHAAGVVHRDIKPANVLLAGAAEEPGDRLGGGPAATGAEPGRTGELRAKLADFGIARLADGARLTVAGTTLGTASYLSPEQATGSAVGPASDVYSLGLVLLECLTGERAFTGTALEAAAARLTSSPAIPGRFGSAWSDVLEAMTQRDPRDRPTAAEVGVRLAVQAEEPAGTGVMPAPTVASPVAASPVEPSPVEPSPVEPSVAAAPAEPPHDGASPVVPTPVGASLRTVGPGSTAVLPVTPVTPVRGGPVPTEPLPAQPGAHRLPATEDGSGRTPPSAPTSPVSAAADAGPAGRSVPARVGGPTAALDADRRARRGTRLAAAALLLCVGGATVLATQVAGDAPPTAPPYPVVGGGLGEALEDLQRSVQP